MADARFYKKSAALSLGEIAAQCDLELADPTNADFIVDNIATLDTAGPMSLTFLDNRKYRDQFEATQAGACIIHPDFKSNAPDNLRLLFSKAPYMAYAKASALLNPDAKPEAAISDTAKIHPSAKIGARATIEDLVVISEDVEIGDDCWISPHTFIGRGVKIGNACRIRSNVTITHAIIGDNVVLYAGVRIGQEGFGFAVGQGGFVKVPQLGRVIIEGHTEIGANTTIDRGALGDTVIGMGSWLDNQIQVAHNVRIGKGCIIAAQVGISGSCEIGDHVMIGGQAGLSGHLKIGNLVKIAAKSGVTKDIPDKEEWMGYPALPMKKFLRQAVMLGKITKRNKEADK